MTVSTTSSELLIFLPPNVVWWYIIISQRVLWGNWIAVFKVKVTAKLQNANECFSRQYLQNHWTFYHQVWFGDASSWTRVSCEKTGWLSSRSRSQQGLRWSKYDSFYYIFWTADPFANRLGLMVHYHRLAYLMKKLVCCVQGQGHSKTSKCQWLFSVFPKQQQKYFKMSVTQCLSKRLVCCLQGHGHS